MTVFEVLLLLANIAITIVILVKSNQNGKTCIFENGGVFIFYTIKNYMMWTTLVLNYVSFNMMFCYMLSNYKYELNKYGYSFKILAVSFSLLFAIQIVIACRWS